MRFTVDPWDPSYGTSLDAEMSSSESTVVVDIEIDPEHWSPITPPSTTQVVETVIFIDGVRRIEARAWVGDNDGTPMPGIFASYAAGAVRCDAQSATITEVHVDRGVYSQASGLIDVVTRHAQFRAHSTDDSSPEALMFAVHHDMSNAEVIVAERARRNGDELIVVDGPLRNRAHIPDAVGLIKSHAVRYLPPELDRIVGELQAGQRTPLFRIDAHPFSRVAWYLALPTPSTAPWAGIVRCEATAALGVAILAQLANTIAITLIKYASEAHKDSRAPQNLYPIGGLEQHLRHRLGDKKLLYRALRTASTP